MYDMIDALQWQLAKRGWTGWVDPDTGRFAIFFAPLDRSTAVIEPYPHKFVVREWDDGNIHRTYYSVSELSETELDAIESLNNLPFRAELAESGPLSDRRGQSLE